MESSFSEEPSGAETVGRYVLHAAIARGGMATVHAARLTGAEGFHRLVAAKRLHPEFTEDPEFVTMFHDEARIASRIHHPNVVPVLDVVVTDSEVMLVQEYVHGVPLSLVMRRARMSFKPVPPPIAVAIVAGVLAGLHAAHEAKDDLGTPLDVIHRDVSPQNVMLSVEGVPRLLDFGIAKARTSAHHTRPGVMKGKLSYMAPEQVKSDPITRRADIYAAGVVMWELLANRRVGDGMSETDFLAFLFDGEIPTLVEECSAWRRSLGQAGWKRLMALDAVVMRAMSLRPGDRFATALEMADALVAAQPPATQAEVATWVGTTASEHLEKLRRTLAQSEEEWRSSARLEAATLSRKSIVVAEPEETATDERVTVPSGLVRAVAEAPDIEIEIVAIDDARDSLFILERATPTIELPASLDSSSSDIAPVRPAPTPRGSSPFVRVAAEGSDPPASLTAVARSSSSSERPAHLRPNARMWPWLAAAAAAFIIGFTTTRQGADPPPPPAPASGPAAQLAPSTPVSIPPLPATLIEPPPPAPLALLPVPAPVATPSTSASSAPAPATPSTIAPPPARPAHLPPPPRPPTRRK